MKNCLLSFLLALTYLMCPAFFVYAQENEANYTEIIQDKANDLKALLDHLLLDSNNSSIQKIIKNGDEPVKVLIAEAFKLKTRGEQLLEEKQYMEAGVSLQSALDYVFQAIRLDENITTQTDKLNAKLVEKLKVNDTFISTASRVITGVSNKDALKLLTKAKQARNKADTESEAGNNLAALEELENSTRLAQQAIMQVRNGMVIERGQ